MVLGFALLTLTYDPGKFGRPARKGALIAAPRVVLGLLTHPAAENVLLLMILLRARGLLLDIPFCIV
ncbi:MAG: hypothetical protein DI537_47850 [Stutzerimonas stutzeri]|nr:MAG: hypothetical protein DI537_47850 [Stutzerimonas stutzeri]